MKYIKELIGIMLIIFLTYILGSWSYVEKLSTLFIPKINRYIYIFVFLGFIYMMGRWIFNKNQINFIGFIVLYSIFLFLTLFVRPKYDTYQSSFSFYLIDWFKELFKNKVIFVNLIGNLMLFTPLGFILFPINKTKIIKILIGIVTIILLELCQFITKRGVFDIVDILLNSIGLILIVLVMRGGNVKIWKTTKTRTKKQNKKNLN